MVAKREELTDPYLKSLAKNPAPKGERYDIMDIVRPMGVRVTDKGTVTFFLRTRFPGSTTPTRRALGEYPTLSLTDARTKARKWRDLIKLGIDPKDQEERHRAEQQRKRENTWRAIVEDYLAAAPGRKRNRHVVQDEREIRRELIERKDRKGKVEWSNPWNDKPFADVSDFAIAELIAAIKDRGNEGMAYNTVGHLKSIFRFATLPKNCPRYDLTPANNIVANRKPGDYELSSKQERARERTLSDAEIRAYWKAAESTPYPLGPFYKLLMLTGQRDISDLAKAEWSEFDIPARLWTVPSERFKAGQVHVVPVSDDALAVLESLPRFHGGDCLFSTRGGIKPINGWSRAKTALDAAMLAELRKHDPKATLPHWVLHDVRRTVRSHLAGLVSRDVAERVIGHDAQGIERVYNRYAYADEKREALDAWAARLRSIVNPTPPAPARKRDNLLQFPKERASA